MDKAALIKLLSSDTKIRTLGLYQPYAGLMFSSDKVETRWVRKGKKPPFPLGWYALYSTKKAFQDHEVKFISGPAYRHIVEERKLRPELFDANGCIIGFAKLVTVERMDHNPIVGAIGRTFVDYQDDHEFDRWILIFENQIEVAHFPYRGKQGVGFLDDEHRLRINHILSKAA